MLGYTANWAHRKIPQNLDFFGTARASAVADLAFNSGPLLNGGRIMPESPKKIDEIVCNAVEIPTADERREYLDGVCGDDVALRQEAANLVDHHFAAGDFLESPLFLDSADIAMQFGLECTGKDNELTAGLTGEHDSILGDYRLIREIARGGMGVVYEAEQISLNRRVALKILPFAAVLDQRQLKRFKTEAKAAASLDHPHIVNVYNVGNERGVHYYAMQYVEGHDVAELICQLRELSRADSPDTESAGYELAQSLASGEFEPPDATRRMSLAEQCTPTVAGPALQTQSRPSKTRTDDTPPCPMFDTEVSTTRREYFRTVAALGIQAAEALQYAHARGVLHRDIKPSNLMINSDGRLLVTDFGLARVDGDVALTMTGDVMGTMRYMSPEQASGRNDVIDCRSDVYSLGATLYEMITLQPLYPGSDHQELLRKRAEEAPVPPREINKAIPVDLETVVLKAIAKEPEDRYATAGEFAADLQRFIDNEPVRARRPSPTTRIWKWFQRHHALSASLVLLAVAGPLAAYGLYKLATDEELAVQYAATLGQQSQATPQERPTARAPGRYLPGLIPEPTYLPKIGRWQLITSSPRGVMRSAVFSPDDKMIAVGESGNVRIYDVDLNLTKVLVGHTGHVSSIAWHPDGKRLASASWDGTVRLWTIDGVPTHVLNGHVGEVNNVKWHPQGKLLASGGSDGTIRIWSNDGAPVEILRDHQSPVFSLDWTADGKRLASGGGVMATYPTQDAGDTVVRLWDFEQAAVVRRFEGHRLSVRCLQFSPDGRQFASASGNLDLGRPGEGSVRLWNVKEGTAGHVMRKPTEYGIDGIETLAWHPRGRFIAAGGYSMHPCLWDTQTGTIDSDISTDNGGCISLAWSSNGSHLAVAGFQSLDVIDRESNDKVSIGSLMPKGVHWWLDQVDWSSDGKWITYRGRLWDHRGHLGPRLPGVFRESGVRFSPDGRYIALGSNNKQLYLVEIEDVSNIRTIDALAGRVNSFVWTNQNQLAICGDSVIKLWNIKDQRVRTLTDQSTDGIKFESLEYSQSDGEGVLVATSEDGTKWRSNDDGKTLGTIPADGEETFPLPSKILSPDRNTTVTYDGYDWKLWLADGTLQTSIPIKRPVTVWSPNGKWIAVGDIAGKVRILRHDGTLERVVQAHTLTAFLLNWSPDSRRLITTSHFASSMRMWNVATGKCQWLAIPFKARAESLVFSSSGQIIDGDREVVEAELRYLVEKPNGAMEMVNFTDFQERYANLLVAAEGERLQLLSQSGSTEEAADALNNLLAFRYSNDPQVHNLLVENLRAVGNRYVYGKKYDEAVVVLSEAITLGRTLVETYGDNQLYRHNLLESLSLRSISHRHGRRCDEAVADASEAIRIDASYADAYINRATAYLCQHRHRDAKADFVKCAELQPNNAILAYDQAILNLAVGDYEGYQTAATAMVERFAKTADPDTAHWVAWTCLLAPGAFSDPTLPLGLAELATKAEPKSLSYAQTLGAALYRAGRYSEALTQFTELAERWNHEGLVEGSRTSPAYTEYFLSMTHEQLGHRQKATHHFRNGVRLHEIECSKSAAWNRRMTLDLFRTEAEVSLGLVEATPNK